MQHSMYNHIEGDSSFNQILEMMKNFKLENNNKISKDSSTIEFSERCASSFRNFPPTAFHRQSNSRTRSPLSNITHRNNNVFERLYEEKKQIDKRKTLLEYESRRSKQQKQRSECTFSPNFRTRIRTDYDSSIDNQSFYNKNIEWLQRRQKSIKVKQIQKNQQNMPDMTFTPRINKFNKKKVVNNGASVYQSKGVEDYLNRQKKVKKIQQFIQTRKKNPYSHVWNVKKGHFSQIK